MKKKILLFFGLMFFLLIGCSGSETQIKTLVQKFYSEYKGDYREMNNRYVTEKLKGLMQEAEALEDEDARLIQNSKFPTDKPLLIEGDIFTSLYEGHTSFTIKTVHLIDETHANVLVVFENKKHDEIWEDEVVLIKEYNRWKIDNVIYKKSSNTLKSTQQYLLQFLNSANTESKE